MTIITSTADIANPQKSGAGTLMQPDLLALKMFAQAHDVEVAHDADLPVGDGAYWRLQISDPDAQYTVEVEWDAREWFVYTCEPQDGLATPSIARRFAADIVRAALLVEQIVDAVPSVAVS